MGDRLQMLKDMGMNLYGLGENVAALGSAAIAEPVAGFAAMYDPQNGAQAIREGMTYQPRGESAEMYQKGVGDFVSKLVKPVMPVVEAWQKGVDIAGRYSPAAGAALQTTPTALAALLGYKPAMQTGRQVSNSLDMLQRRVVANANAPRTLNTGYMGQRGAIGTQRPLTEFEQAHLTAQRNAALPISQGGLGLPADNTAMDRARAMGYDVDNPVYHGTNWDIEAFDPKKSLDVKGVHVGQQHQANHFSKGVGGANYPLLIKKQRIMEDMPDSFLNPDRLYDDFAREVQYNDLTKDSYHGDLLWKAKKADEAAGFKTREDGVTPKEKAYFKELNRILKENDIDSISYENEKEFLRNHDNTSYLIPDVRKVRSVNAAFDPKKAKSSNLLAQSAKVAPTAGIAAYLYNQQNKDKQ